jgi:hypothetical protein
MFDNYLCWTCSISNRQTLIDRVLFTLDHYVISVLAAVLLRCCEDRHNILYRLFFQLSTFLLLRS